MKSILWLGVKTNGMERGKGESPQPKTPKRLSRAYGEVSTLIRSSGVTNYNNEGFPLNEFLIFLHPLRKINKT